MIKFAMFSKKKYLDEKGGDSILDRFPKERKDLPPEYRDIYTAHYKKNRQGKTKVTSLSKMMETWMHNRVADDIGKSEEDISTLEIGAGNLNHFEYEPHILSYDIVEPFTELYKDSDAASRVRNIFMSIDDVDINHTYQRITSIATFEHIMQLPEVVAKAVLHLKDGGRLRVGIPNEGTILWKIGTLFTGAEFKKLYGLDYQILMKYEHVNTANEIECVLRYFFKNVSVKSFGINRRFSFYRFLNCENPDLDNARKYLDAIKRV